MCNTPVRLPSGTCPFLGSYFWEEGEDTWPLSHLLWRLYTGPSLRPVSSLPWVPVRRHPAWQGSLAVFEWEWGHGPSSKCPQHKVIKTGMDRTETLTIPAPSTLLPTARTIIEKLQKLKLVRFLLALCLWECFYLSTKWLSFNEFLIIWEALTVYFFRSSANSSCMVFFSFHKQSLVQCRG